jgi:hypothetical protein
MEAHERAITSSKVLAFIGVDFLMDPEFRKEVKKYHKNQGGSDPMRL